MFHVYIFVQAICPGVYGGHRVRQVHEADQQSGDDPLQHERPHHAQERLLLPPLQDRGHEVGSGQRGRAHELQHFLRVVCAGLGWMLFYASRNEIV